MVWRLRLHRIRRVAEKLLRVAAKVGIIGSLLVVAGAKVISWLQQKDLLAMGLPLLLLGGLLFMGGVGFALAGEAPTLAEYAEGESDELPAASKLFSGLVASCGGLAIGLIGLFKLLH